MAEQAEQLDVDNTPCFLATDVAYLAGIIDGEGCINMSKQWGHGRWHYGLHLSVTSTSDVLKVWLSGTFGGLARTVAPKNSNCTEQLHWTMAGNRCQALLRLVLPYLKIKRPQAELALMVHFDKHGGNARWNSIYTEEEELVREKVRLAIHEYNRAGGNKGSYLWNANGTRKEVYAPSQGSCGTMDSASIGVSK